MYNMYSATTVSIHMKKHQPKNNHYVYLLTFPNGMFYVGCRSTNLEPEQDTTYLGSGKYLPKDRHEYRNLIQKDILFISNSREDALDFEEEYIMHNNCVTDENFYNKRRRVFDRKGLPNPNPMNSILRAKAAKTFKQRDYTKNGNRTVAQLAHDEWCRKNYTGVENPAKGHKGVTNCAFVPWYYITPEGNYVEVLDKTKEDYVSLGILPFTWRQLIHRFHYTNQHKISKRTPFKGWVFGNLPIPEERKQELGIA